MYSTAHAQVHTHSRFTCKSLARVYVHTNTTHAGVATPKALAQSSAIRHAGDWLNVIPSSALGLHMFDQEFRLCLRYWLGLPLFPVDSTCLVCLSPADSFGDHHVGCGGNGDKIHRHNSIRDAIFTAAQSAALAPRRESPHLIPNRQSRPACWHLSPKLGSGPSSCLGYFSHLPTPTSYHPRGCRFSRPRTAGWWVTEEGSPPRTLCMLLLASHSSHYSLNPWAG